MRIAETERKTVRFCFKNVQKTMPMTISKTIKTSKKTVIRQKFSLDENGKRIDNIIKQRL